MCIDGGVLRADTRPIVRTRQGFLTRRDLMAQARELSLRLASGPAAVNLCDSREHFLAALLALEMRGQTCLMPPSRAAAVVAEVIAEHAGSFEITDALVAAATSQRQPAMPQDLAFPAQRTIAIAYTSGSTGRPKPNAKTWGAFAATTHHNAACIRAALPTVPSSSVPWIVATVPSQHMYGMEFAVMLPLLEGMGIHAAHPLFPADIAATLAQVPEPRILVSTPVHLKALLESQMDLPPLAAVLSATAPLSAAVAAEIERRYATSVVEFFGSTETCVIASRRTAHEIAWRPHSGVVLREVEGGTSVDAPWFGTPLQMQDVFDIDADGRFIVVGRSADMVEVAGKRASLADLTRRLLAVPGVRDAVVFQPDSSGDAVKVRRLAAFVVAPGLTEQVVAEGLARACDPVFVPRPLIVVPSLPRNEVGKLPREQLLTLLREHSRPSREPL